MSRLGIVCDHQNPWRYDQPGNVSAAGSSPDVPRCGSPRVPHVPGSPHGRRGRQMFVHQAGRREGHFGNGGPLLGPPNARWQYRTQSKIGLYNFAPRTDQQCCMEDGPLLFFKVRG